MTEAPNQTPIEPSEEAVSAATTEFFGEDGYGLRAEIEAALVIAYAIDLAPIIAERDETKIKFKILSKLYMHTMTKYRDRLDELAKATAERDRMKAALEIIETASRAYERGEIPMVEHFLKALITARAALEPKP